jgi:hypothetical protein
LLSHARIRRLSRRRTRQLQRSFEDTALKQRGLELVVAA